MSLRYTEEVPTETGWYWYKNGSMEVVVKFDEELQHHAVQQRKKSELAGKPGPFWAGPIPTPLMPAEEPPESLTPVMEGSATQPQEIVFNARGVSGIWRTYEVEGKIIFSPAGGRGGLATLKVGYATYPDASLNAFHWVVRRAGCQVGRGTSNTLLGAMNEAEEWAMKYEERARLLEEQPQEGQE